MGSVPVDADHTQGLALWSSDGVHWNPASGALVTAMGGIVLASTGPSWHAEVVIGGRDGGIAVGQVDGAPGAELWWHSSDGQQWQLLANYPPLGAWPGPGEESVASRTAHWPATGRE